MLKNFRPKQEQQHINYGNELPVDTPVCHL